MKRLISGIVALLAMTLSVSTALGDDGNESDPPPPPAAQPKPPVPALPGGPLRDPTQSGPEVTPQSLVAPPAMPRLALKGLIQVRGRPATALIEMDGAVRRVEEGMELRSAPDTNGRIARLRVVRVGPADVRVQQVETGQLEVLR